MFSIPKRLRIYFMYDRKLLAGLSRCAWKVLGAYLKQSTSDNSNNPGAVIAVQTFGDFQNFHPHLHIIATDGCFADNGIFQKGQHPYPRDLEDLFRYEVLKMLKSEGKINQMVIENMLSWHHSGFNIYCGNTIRPHDPDATEKLARYVIRAAFSQERMNYISDDRTSDGIAKVIYQSKDRKTFQTFHALDWLAQLNTHIPNKREQMVRYYGYYSNKSRGLRKKAGKDDDIPAVINAGPSPKSFRKNWARLIQKIYEIDPMVCPKCQGEMRIIAFIEFPHIIKRILEHLGLWLTHNHDPPKPQVENNTGFTYDDAYSQIPSYDYWIQ